MPFDLYIKGLLVGLAISIPVGPIALLCIRRSLDQGRVIGLISGLGATLADGLYGALAVFGLSTLTGPFFEHQDLLLFGGAMAFLFMGFKSFVTRVEERMIPKNASTMVKAFLSSFLLTLTNPGTIIALIGIFAGLELIDVQTELHDALTLLVGLVTGSALWWFGLSGLAARFHGRMSPAALNWLNRISGILFIMFALVILYRLGTTGLAALLGIVVEVA